MLRRRAQVEITPDTKFHTLPKGLFDNIDHELLMRAVKHHTDCKWVILYIERWLKAPMQKPDGASVERSKGTPQGGVVSPVLSRVCEPILRGWEQYYGKYNNSSLNPIYQHFNRTLMTWAMGKYKKLRGRKIAAGDFIEGIARKRPQLFTHWSRGLLGFAGWERCESRGSCTVPGEAWGEIPLAYSLSHFLNELYELFLGPA